jgi:hypothetical protein
MERWAQGCEVRLAIELVLPNAVDQALVISATILSLLRFFSLYPIVLRTVGACVPDDQCHRLPTKCAKSIAVDFFEINAPKNPGRAIVTSMVLIFLT